MPEADPEPGGVGSLTFAVGQLTSTVKTLTDEVKLLRAEVSELKLFKSKVLGASMVVAAGVSALFWLVERVAAWARP